ncbi:MAG TPA: sensor histidine kinase [Candidatus Acidoferrales bacterium]|nr:sensor histidine kinase [Candidatus Acidoferrales bacterium]
MDNRIRDTQISSFQTTSGESSKPRITRRGVGIVLVIWCVYTLLAAIPLAESYHVPFLRALYWQTFQSAVMLVLSIPVWFIVVRRMYAARWYWKALVHLFLAPTYVIVNYEYLYYSVFLFGGKEAADPLKTGAGWLLYFNFLIYVLQFALYHSYEILRKLRVKEKATLELLALQKEQELATLKAQLNPHFLFNTLNSISAMAATDTEETRTMIAQLGDLLRYAIESSQKDFVSLKDELQFIQDYVALESKRLEDRLEIEFQVDHSLDSLLIPPMILQPLVENAIKHGIAPAEDGGKVCLRIGRQKDRIVFQISDTGVGISCVNPLATTNGVGLKNIDARLRKMYGDAARLEIQPRVGGGCEVMFVLPLS